MAAYRSIPQTACIRQSLSTAVFSSSSADSVKSMLDSMDDGEISVSAYDTAWVALVEDIHGSGAQQFPSTLHWIADNQLSDGSWGDRYKFSANINYTSRVSWCCFPTFCLRCNADHLIFFPNCMMLFSVPCVYPIDLFERIWVVDRLQRLGISVHEEVFAH